MSLVLCLLATCPLTLPLFYTVLYVEACESGSVFAGYLPPDRHILAVTAANTTSPSYACCYDPSIGAYLGDAFSVRWVIVIRVFFILEIL